MKRVFSRKPRVWRIRYEREDGCYREITVSDGWGRFRVGREKNALEIAERRLSEQYGQALFQMEQQERELRADPNYLDLAAQLVRMSPGLHQDNYRLVSVTEVKRGR